MEDLAVKFLIGATVIVLAGCSSMDYKPVQERSFSQLLSEGCKEPGEQMLVTGYVSKAYQDTVVLWDGIDPQSTVAVKVPGPGLKQRLKGWLGADSKQEVTAETLNSLGAQRQPVTVGLVCQGENVAPEVRTVNYTDAQGQRVAIAY
jgi:hypothetical protein